MNKQGLLLRLILTLILMCTNVGLYAYDVEVDGIYYNLNTNAKTAEVTRNNNERYEGNISIPESIFFNGKNYSVTSIGEAAFYYCNGLTSVIIPNCVTSFGFSAFQNCSGLTSITIPNNVTDIGDSAFSGCSGLTSITIPNNVTSICNNTFAYCSSLTSIVIPDNVTSIGNFAFYNCSSLTSIKIPNGVKSIGNSAFMRCIGLTTLTIPNSVTSIGNGAFYGCSGLSSITIPNSVTSIGSSAFAECSGLTSITIPNNITSIEHSTFSGCSSLTSITIPNGVKSIGAGAFMLCNGLTLITIPNSVTSIGGSAFAGCRSLTSITIPNSVTSIGEKAFMLCDGLTSIIIPNNVTSIGNSAFSDCSSLTSIIIPNNVTSIGNSAFYCCSSLTSIIIPNNVTSIGNSAFCGCSSLTSITIPNGVTKIDNDTFYACSGLTSITIPNSVISIGNSSLYGCSGLTAITIPNSLTSIGSYAFAGCRSLTSITIPNSVTSIGNSAFAGCSEVTSIVVNSGNTVYDSREGCNAIIKTSDNRLIAGCKNTTIHNTVTRIGGRAFYYCSGMSSIIIPISVISIGEEAFSYCSGLTSVISEIQNPFIISDNVFNKISSEAVLLVPKGTKNKYDSYSGWTKYFKEIVEAADNNNYNLTVSSSGNGSVLYNGITIRGGSQTFIVEEGTNTTVTFTPDNGYRIASVKLNDTDVTSSVSNNKYTINNITQNTTLKVTFEAIPLTTYTLSITASGNGSATFNSTTVKNKTQSFTVNEGTNVTVLFTPDNGYRIASVKVNNTDVTSSVSNNKYIISNISANATLKVTFEAIPATTYSLSITVSGNGSASYNSTTFRNNTLSFTVNEGASATITFTPDSEYLVARVKVNNTDVTSNVSNNQYVISNIIQDTSLEVEFEKESSDYDITQHISAYNIGGSVTQTNDLINSGSQLNWTFSNDSEYSVTFKSMQLIDGKTGVEGNVMNVDKMVEAGTSVSYSTTIGASGIHIPVTCRFRYVFNGNEYYTDAVYSGNSDNFTLSIKSTGNGEVTYDGKTIRNSSETFSVRMMSSPTLSFTPDNGCCVKSLLVNNKDVTSGISNNRYTLGLIMSNTSVEVVFEEIMDALTVDGVNYSVTSQNNRTVTVVGGTYGQVLTVPETVVWKGSTWTVIGIDNDALKNNKELAAVIWNPAAAFTATVSNPNLLLYVKKEEYAPLSVQNVVVNGTASNIVLKEATSGNNFYCPQSFVAQKISFTHNYQMQTGIGESRGWETIALPFDVQSITHQTVGAIKPFAKWKSGDSEKPFWLYELTGTGWNEADGIKAYTPYIISMPNNSQYNTQWILKGSVTFAASNVTVDKTENVNMPSYRERTFVPCYANQEASADIYALNVKNDYVTNSSNMTEGSWFVQNLRQVHPFEAYMTSSSQAQEFFGVLENGIETIDSSQETVNRFYDLQGRMVQGSKLPKGIYIMNGKKMLIK